MNKEAQTDKPPFRWRRVYFRSGCCEILWAWRGTIPIKTNKRTESHKLPWLSRVRMVVRGIEEIVEALTIRSHWIYTILTNHGRDIRQFPQFWGPAYWIGWFRVHVLWDESGCAIYWPRSWWWKRKRRQRVLSGGSKTGKALKDPPDPASQVE